MTNASNRTQHLRAIRTDAYSSLLEGQVLLARGGENRDTALTRKGQQTVRDALLRIAVFSPREVAVPVATYYASLRKNVLCSYPSDADFRMITAMYHALRRATFDDDGQAISDSIIALLALGCLYRPR